LVAHADNLTLFDLEEFLLQHQQRPDECVGTMMTFNSDNPRSCGIVELDNRGIVKAFHEKVENPPGTLANAAVFIFSPAALGIISRLVGEGYTDISLDLIPHLLGKLFSFHNGTYHRDIGTLDALAAAETEFPKIYKEFARKGSLQ
jgi:mannose-1-phosphate guanylyltransferase